MRLITPEVNDVPTLLVVGSLTGALAGGATAALVLLEANFSLRALPLEAIVIGATVGAALGAILFSLALRFAIRNVPLGRAAVTSLVGTTAGATLALWFPQLVENALLRAVGGGTVGFVLTAIALRLTLTPSSS